MLGGDEVRRRWILHDAPVSVQDPALITSSIHEEQYRIRIVAIQIVAPRLLATMVWFGFLIHYKSASELDAQREILEIAGSPILFARYW